MIPKDFSECINHFNKVLNIDKNFDIVFRPITIANRKAALYFIDGFCKTAELRAMLEFIMQISNNSVFENASFFANKYISGTQSSATNDENQIITAILSGESALFIDGFSEAILINTRSYPQRTTSEPDKDKVFRGSRDGFVESIILNTALIRRRIRDPKLIFNHMQVGTKSKTDVALCYIKEKADISLLNKIKQKLKQTNVESLTMNQESIAELLQPKQWRNPLPKFKFTERPDAAAAHILEGDIAIIVDNSPAVLIVPITIFSIMEEANDFYFPPVISTYLKLTRAIVMLLTALITPIWLLIIQNPQIVPTHLRFILTTDDTQVPLVIQLLILEIAIDGLNLASLNTPNMLVSSLSILAAIIVGDYAVESGWFSSQALLYTAFVSLSSFAQPGYELGYALKFIRMFLLILTGIFGSLGFLSGFILTSIMILKTKTLSGKSYLYPLIPFDWKKFKQHLYRASLSEKPKNNKY